MLEAAATALFDEHAKPTHCSRKDICAGLAPIDQLAASARRQVMEYQLQVASIEAALDGEDPNDGITEHMHQTFGAIEREAAALALASRNLAKSMKQLDAYMATARADLTQKGILASTVAAPSVP